MGSLFELLNSGELVENKPIVEPLNGREDFLPMLRKFFPEEIYLLSESSLLYKFMLSLLGDAGLGGILKAFLYPRMQKALTSTNFNDLDLLFANPVALPRLSDEIYTIDPKSEIMTQAQWAEVLKKDAWYKARASDFMLAIKHGNTPTGLAYAAKAGSNIDSEIFERWKYLDDIVSDEPIGVQNIGRTYARDEIVVILETSALVPQTRRRVTSALSRLKPANSTVTLTTRSLGYSELPIAEVAASSEFFTVRRLVTGSDVIQYPPVSTDHNTWIESGVEKEAPTFAYNLTSEAITYPTIENASATSYHIGSFNNLQRLLFSHLENAEGFEQFGPEQAYLDIPLGYTITAPWVAPRQTTFLVNKYYPLGYFADSRIAKIEPNRKTFWASAEDYPDVEESLEVSFQVERPINVVEFEICQKPIDIEVEYWNGTAWTPVTLRTDVANTTQVYYDEVSEHSWFIGTISFEKITTNKIRMNFGRRPDPFPEKSSELFPWSVEVRNLRFGHIIASANDFEADSGADILGNLYRTDLASYPASNVIDGDDVTFWQSQANPSRNAVESLYFDIRQGGSASIFDEIQIDAVTLNVLTHVYYSDDEDEEDWDYKLWSPIPRHYLLSNNPLVMPRPVRAKFVKVEFTQLAATPYPLVLRKNIAPFITYKTHPTWVLENLSTIRAAEDAQVRDSETAISLDYETIGAVITTDTKLDKDSPISNEDFISTNEQEEVLAEYEVWQDTQANQPNVTDAQIYPNDLYQRELFGTVKDDDYLTRLLRAQNRGSRSFNVESPLLAKELLNIGRRSDDGNLQIERAWPETWFPRRCRHGYKVIETKREFEVAYFVGIRDLKFIKRDRTQQRDDALYLETLADTNSVDVNTFQQADWRFGISREAANLVGSTVVPTFGFENFDGVSY